jgi:hypothetical protein
MGTALPATRQGGNQKEGLGRADLARRDPGLHHGRIRLGCATMKGRDGKRREDGTRTAPPGRSSPRRPVLRPCPATGPPPAAVALLLPRPGAARCARPRLVAHPHPHRGLCRGLGPHARRAGHLHRDLAGGHGGDHAAVGRRTGQGGPGAVLRRHRGARGPRLGGDGADDPPAPAQARSRPSSSGWSATAEASASC